MLGLVSLLMDISSEMITTLLPLYLVSGLGASALAIGFIEGFSVFIATATKLFSGYFVDWSHRAKPLAVLGYGLGALSRLIFPLAATIDQIVLAKAMDRVGKGIRGTPRDAIIAAVSSAEIRGAAFGLRKSLDTVGGFLGPLIAVALMLILAGDIAAVFWWAAVPAALAIGVLVLFVREPAQGLDAKSEAFSLRRAISLNRGVWTVIGLAGLIMLARFSEAFVLLKSLDAGFSPAYVPLAMVVMHAVYGLAAYPVGKIADRVGAAGLLATSLAFLGLAHLLLSVADNVPLFLAGTIFWGLHMGFSQGLLGALIAVKTSACLKGSAFGTFNMVTGVVVLVGNLAAGWLWTTGGSQLPFQIGAGIACAAMLVTLALRKSLVLR